MFLNGQNRQSIFYVLFALELFVLIVVLTTQTCSLKSESKFVEVEREEIKSFDGSCKGLLWER